MSLVHFNFESAYLHNNTDVDIILPDRPRATPPKDFYGGDKKYKVLWLLHGTYGDYSDWLRKTMIEVYARERDLIVVMPTGLNAFYLNWPGFACGYQCYDYLFEELMPMLYSWFPASSDPKDNFIAGLSMGGYGALYYMLGHPEKFGGCASLSYVPSNMDDPAYRKSREELSAEDKAELDAWASDISVEGVAQGMRLRTRNMTDRFASLDDYAASDENIWPRFKELLGNENMPKLMFTNGTEDHFFGTNGKYDRFIAYLDEIGLPYRHSEGPGGHEWRVWDRDIELVLDYFEIPKVR